MRFTLEIFIHNTIKNCSITLRKVTKYDKKSGIHTNEYILITLKQ